ncbi:hypothetical protein MRX96_011032 [Rhipicephalus microplus]
MTVPDQASTLAEKKNGCATSPTSNARKGIPRYGPDSVHSWMTAGACALATFFGVGGRRSSGFLYVAILDTFGATRTQAAWPIILLRRRAAANRSHCWAVSASIYSTTCGDSRRLPLEPLDSWFRTSPPTLNTSFSAWVLSTQSAAVCCLSLFRLSSTSTSFATKVLPWESISLVLPWAHSFFQSSSS